MWHRSAQQLRGQPDMTRHITGVVDDGIPVAPREAAHLSVAIALDARDLRETVGVGTAAVEEGQPMTAIECVLRHM